jgi:protein-tyrosine phosphatase
MPDLRIRICFVCLGNICRSPTAEGVMKKLIQDTQKGSRFDGGFEIEVESAGTASYHVGESSDPRARDAASKRGVVLDQRGQQFLGPDFERFDYVLAMDLENLENLRSLTRETRHLEKLRLLREFDRSAAPGAEVPDPYYGGDRGFEEVLDQCERACRGLLEELLDIHRPDSSRVIPA